MRVLILTSLFHPEIAANAKRMTHLAEELKRKGHEVSVVTAFPYYSATVDREKYRRKWIVREQYEGIPVIRTYTYCPKRYRSFASRILCFLSFMVSSIFGAHRVKGKVDVVLTISPPFFSLFSGYIISRIKRASWVIDIQDIYPETLVALGFLKNRIAIGLLERCERFFYRKAAGIVGISEGFKRDFVQKGAVPEKASVVPNWVDTDLFSHVQTNGLRQEYGLDGRFVVMFVGTMGFAQGLEHVVDAGRLIASQEPSIQFVFLGEGVEKAQLQRRVEEYGLSNFTFIPRKPNSEIPAFLAMADVCLVHLRWNRLYEITIPCKTYEYLAAGKPVIMGVKGEALHLVEEAGCGVGIEPESPEDLASTILTMCRDRSRLARMGQLAGKCATERFSKDVVLSQYVGYLESYNGGGKPPISDHHTMSHVVEPCHMEMLK